MGCWNKTCALTNLPIGEGERVITFLIVNKKSSYENRCYTNWAWELIPVPIYGEYDDYGWMNEDEGQDHKLEFFNKQFVQSLERIKPYDEGNGDRSYIRYPDLKDSPFESFKVLGESMHGDVFGLRDWYDKDYVSLISHIMIRQDAFDMQKDACFQSDSEGTSSMPKEYIIEVINSYKDFESNKFNKINELIENETDAEKREMLMSRKMLMSYSTSDITLDDFINKNLAKMRKEHGLVVSYDWYATDYAVLKTLFSRNMGSSIGYITQAVLNNVIKCLDTNDLLDIYCLENMYTNLRKSYHPQGGEGSQNELNSHTRQFAFTYIKSASNHDGRWDDDDNESLSSTKKELDDALETIKRLSNEIEKLRQYN